MASLGGWTQGYPLWDTPQAVWDRVLQNNLTAHFRAIRLLVPLLRARPHPTYYLSMGGFSALDPAPTAGAVSAVGAAQLALTRILAQELAGTPVVVRELMLMTPVLTRGRRTSQPGWLHADAVAEAVVRMAAGPPPAPGADPVVYLPEGAAPSHG